MKEKLPKDLNDFEAGDEVIITDAEGSHENAIMKYGKLILIATVIIIVIVGVFYYFSYTNQKNITESATALSRVMSYFEQGEYSRALVGGDSVPMVRGEKVMGLKEIADEYGSTPSGKLAALMAGESLVNLNRIGEAKNYFELATDSKSEVVIKGGYAGLGLCYEKENNLAEAVQQYEIASEHSVDSGSKARYMFYAALCYERMGEKSKAEKILLELVNNRDYLEFETMANAALVRLGTKIE